MTELATISNQIAQQLNNEQYDKLHYEFFKNFESKHTRKSYENDIAQFFRFMKTELLEVSLITQLERVHIIAYKSWLSEYKEFAPKTVNRKLSSISSYFDFLIDKLLLDKNPCQNIKRPKQVVKNPTNDLLDHEIQSLFTYLDDPNNEVPLMHRAVIYVFFTTGIRKSELINLRPKDIKELDNYKVIEVKAKGAKFLTKVLHPKCFEALTDHLDYMKAIGQEVLDNDFIFSPSKNPLHPENLKKSLRPKSVDYIVHKYVKKIGVTRRITPHSARASYIGSCLENGADLYRVSQDVGHATVKTTQEYNKRRMKLSQSPVHDLPFLKEKESA